MGTTNQSQKSPFLAGLLSAIFPGLGQFYNEQVNKGLLILFLFLGSGFLMVLIRQPFFLDPFGLISGPPSPHPPFNIFNPVKMGNMGRMMPMLWFFLVAPILYIYSIADAVIDANRRNEGKQTIRAASVRSTTSETEDVMNQQETLREEAHKTRGQAVAEEKEEGTSKRKKCRSLSAKFVLGLILVLIGTFAILPELRIDMTYWWNLLWPVIPLLLGLRLLKDYMYEREQGQFILGMIFSLIGVIFLMENWQILPMWSIIIHYWEFALIGFGLLLMVMDSFERRTYQRKRESE